MQMAPADQPHQLTTTHTYRKRSMFWVVKRRPLSLRSVIKSLVEKEEPRVIRIHIDDHTNQKNYKTKTSGPKADIRDDPDWQLAYKKNGHTWAWDAQSFYWLPKSVERVSHARGLYASRRRRGLREGQLGIAVMTRLSMSSPKLERIKQRNPSLATLLDRLSAYIRSQTADGQDYIIPKLAGVALHLTDGEHSALLQKLAEGGVLRRIFNVYCRKNNALLATVDKLDNLDEVAHCDF